MGGADDGPAIEALGLTKRYEDLTAVDRLDLTVERGEVFGLLGPNGAGKTTTILMLLGLSEPSAGTARVLGLDPARDPIGVKRRVGYLPDSVGFYPDLTGRQNLRYTARLNRLPVGLAAARIERLAGEVGLVGRLDDRVGTYSRGMVQRLGLADTLVKDPEVVILDEPTAAIDPEGVQEMLALIRRLPERRVTVLVSSHLLDQVQAVCDRIGIFVSGRLVACGPIAELAGGGTVLEVEVSGSAEAVEAVLGAVPGVWEVRGVGKRWLVQADGDCRNLLARAVIDAGLGLSHLSQRHQDLGDIYHQYFVDTIAGGPDDDTDAQAR